MIRRFFDALMFRIQYIYRKLANPDKYPAFIMADWKRSGGEEFDLNNPKTYCQKQQWAKIYDTDSRKTVLADKVAVRAWVRDMVGEEYLIPCLGVYDYPFDIDYSKLPNQFVIKMNHSSHMNIIVKDKNQINISNVKKKLIKWSKVNFAFPTLELQYKNIIPRALIEKYISDSNGELKEYKFFCFNGRVFCLYIMEGRNYGSEGLKMGIMDRNFKLMPYTRKGIPMIHYQPEKPKNYNKMIEIAEVLSKDFSHVRVDLYNVDGKIYFGEMTFTSACGFGFYDQKEFDEMLGELWDIPINV